MGARVYVKKNMINLDKFLLLVNHHPIHTHRDGHPDLVPVVDTVSTRGVGIVDICVWLHNSTAVVPSAMSTGITIDQTAVPT